MPLTELDTVRAQYLWALHRHKPALEDQVKDLAKVFGALMQAETLRRQAQADPPDDAILPPAAAGCPVRNVRVASAHQPSPNGAVTC